MNNTQSADLTMTSAPLAANTSLAKGPILYNQTQPDQNQTVMVDDIMSVYSATAPPPVKNNNIPKATGITITTSNDPSDHLNHIHHHQNCPKNKQFNHSVDSINLICNSESNLNKNFNTNKTSLSEKMRKELCTEDIYTLRFATTGPPIEPFDPTTPKEHHSYLYNGSLNRPAFEIISHADVRPATPIKFEQCKEFTMSPNKLYDNNNVNSTKQLTNKYDNNLRSKTSPIQLNYGNQMSVRQTGQPVEWQMASELRTVDWDKLKNASNYDKNNNSFHYTSIDELNEVSDSGRKYKTNTEDSSFYLDNDYNNIRHSTIGVKNPFNDIKLGTSKLTSENETSFDGEQSKNLYKKNQNTNNNNKTKNKSELENINLLEKNTISTINNDSGTLKNLSLIENLNKNKNNNNDIKSSDITSNNLLEDNGRFQASIGGDDRGGGGGIRRGTNDWNDRGTSGKNTYNNSKHSNRRGGRTSQQVLSREYEIKDEKEINHNTKSSILTKIIRDLETNEILSVKFIKDPNITNTNDDVDSSLGGSNVSLNSLDQTNNNNNNNINNNNNNDQINKSNVSIIDVTYQPIIEQMHKSFLELEDEIENDEDPSNFDFIPIPPVQFQQQNSDIIDKQSRRNSSNKSASNSDSKDNFHNHLKRLSSSNNNNNREEDFKTGNEINLNIDEIEIESNNNNVHEVNNAKLKPTNSIRSRNSGSIPPPPPPPPPTLSSTSIQNKILDKNHHHLDKDNTKNKNNNNNESNNFNNSASLY